MLLVYLRSVVFEYLADHTGAKIKFFGDFLNDGWVGATFFCVFMRPPKASTVIEARKSSAITRVWPLRAHPLYIEFHFRIIKIILKSEKKLKIKAMLKFFLGIKFFRRA